MNDSLKDKERQAIERLRAFAPKDGDAYFVAYSGGKDSTYMLPLGSFKPSWTVEKLDQRFADEEKKR